MSVDDLFIKNEVDVSTAYCDENPLAGLPLWTSTHKAFDEHCRQQGFDITYTFNLIFYGSWQELLSEDRVYKIIRDAVNIMNNIRVRHSEFCIVYRPDLRRYLTLTERFETDKLYVEGVGITMGADFTNRGNQFLRMLYSLMCMATSEYFRKFFPDLGQLKPSVGLNLSLYFYHLNDIDDDNRRSDNVDTWLLEDSFYIRTESRLAILSPESAITRFWDKISVDGSVIGDPQHIKTEKFIKQLYSEFCKKNGKFRDG